MLERDRDPLYNKTKQKNCETERTYMTNPVIDFLTGEMPYEEFMERWNRDDSLLDRLKH